MRMYEIEQLPVSPKLFSVLFLQGLPTVHSVVFGGTSDRLALFGEIRRLKRDLAHIDSSECWSWGIDSAFV